MARGSASGTFRQFETAEREIQNKLLEIFNFHTITSAIHQNTA